VIARPESTISRKILAGSQLERVERGRHPVEQAERHVGQEQHGDQRAGDLQRRQEHLAHALQQQPLKVSSEKVRFSGIVRNDCRKPARISWCPSLANSSVTADEIVETAEHRALDHRHRSYAIARVKPPKRSSMSPAACKAAKSSA